MGQCCCEEGCRVCDESTIESAADLTYTITLSGFTGALAGMVGCELSNPGFNDTFVLSTGVCNFLPPRSGCSFGWFGNFTLTDLCVPIAGTTEWGILSFRACITYNPSTDITEIATIIFITPEAGGIGSIGVVGQFTNITGRITCCGYSLVLSVTYFDIGAGINRTGTVTINISC